jgi:hypothetical protein
MAERVTAFDKARSRKRERAKARVTKAVQRTGTLEEAVEALMLAVNTLLKATKEIGGKVVDVGQNGVVTFEAIREQGEVLDAHSEALEESHRKLDEQEHRLGVVQDDINAICQVLGLPNRIGG